MGKILDFIVGNTLVFAVVIILLLAILVMLLSSIAKSLKNHKIPIYEELNEDEELENAKEENVIEKPAKKEKKADKKKEVKEEIKEDDVVSVEEEEKIEETVSEENVSEESVSEEIETVEAEDEDQEEIVEEEVEQEFDDETLREELEKIADKDIEERIDEEHKKNIDEEIKENDNEELKEILSGMKDTNEVDPEEAVRNFEAEQEASSIISYQELVNVVKNRENEFDDELESKPLTTVSDFIKKEKKKEVEPEIDVLEMIERLDNTKKQKKETPKKVKKDVELEDVELEDVELEDVEVLEIVEANSVDKKEKEEIEEMEILSEIPEEGRFKKTDVISPVFGRIQEKNKIDYPKVEKFNRRAKKEEESSSKELDKDIFQSVMPDFSSITSKNEDKKEEKTKSFEDISTPKVERKAKKVEHKDIEEQEEEIESLSAISKNEDFLKALRDFRNSL